MSNVQDPKLDWEGFADFLRSMRQQYGWSQREFAELIGRKQADVSNIETCNTQPTVEMLFRIAVVLRLTVADLAEVLEDKVIRTTVHKDD